MTEPQGALPACACPDPRLWGKEHGLSRAYPVMCHLLDVAAVFAVLWDELLDERARGRFAQQLGLGVDDCRSVLSLWAGLHDLGKITPVFQAQVPELFDAVRDEPEYLFAPGAERDRGFRHEMATHWSLVGLLADAEYPNRRVKATSEGSGAPLAHWVAQLLGGHHGLFGATLSASHMRCPSRYQMGLGEEGWAGQRRLHFEELRRVTGAHAVPTGALSADLAVVLAGLVITADWLASQTQAIVAVRPPASWQGSPDEIDAHFKRATAAAPGLVAAARLGRASFDAADFGEMFPFEPNPLQADVVAQLPGLVAQHGSGLVLVTAPTGDGKTEAALYAASVLGRVAGARGLYMALPTMATADAMFGRVRSFASGALGGERALTLLHSMAWLNPLYAQGTSDASDDEPQQSPDTISADGATAVEADAWLRGPKRGFLAPLSVGTIDQVLSGVLPLRYNVLRLLGLFEKVFLVDEAHAYGPWMHKLLLTLLEWLGAFRAPVVLLSATLTGSTAASLVNAYRRGAGFVESADIEPRYPGWLYASAETGEVSLPRTTSTGRPRTLDVAVRRVAWDVLSAAPGSPVSPGGRRAALREELRPVVEEGGTALVCCTTVAEAQRTFRDLRAAFPELAAREGGVRLLHSRFPANARQRITTECEAAYGKPRDGERVGVREASVLVATQVVEQSLDLDFDLVVSDLAPLAQLLQRAGRGRRHHRGPGGRPAWARAEDRPRLVVLDPFQRAQKTDKPLSWGSVYDTSLLIRTSLLLAERAAGGIVVPDGVQELVDAVYAPDFVDGLDAAAKQELRVLDGERLASTMAETDLADMVDIGGPGDIQGNLHLISRQLEGVTEELLTTRLGADTGRVLCVYVQEDGRQTLDTAGAVPVPGAEGRPLNRDAIARIVAHVAPVPGKWVRDAASMSLPDAWGKSSALRDLTVLLMTKAGDGLWSCRCGDRTIGISEVGIEQL
ncbi:CRISPR-associated endonuclease Cas3'' [Streptomyces sp. RY43-2]|uniref:CRISPR-associated endonuclease Cas3 n=1 Tax=Streptomyces macrolidinus TaxID=2952607 RepID=A0ABT0ZGK5_9ACTN|nr:CRISPR-associated endonuclease Cas3'' [Streptomyces macrolidinus]MCN9242709.1 CRISPR-associated endonuclease Cas3'' [Streptomyces macrolidinus]